MEGQNLGEIVASLREQVARLETSLGNQEPEDEPRRRGGLYRGAPAASQEPGEGEAGGPQQGGEGEPGGPQQGSSEGVGGPGGEGGPGEAGGGSEGGEGAASDREERMEMDSAVFNRELTRRRLAGVVSFNSWEEISQVLSPALLDDWNTMKGHFREKGAKGLAEKISARYDLMGRKRFRDLDRGQREEVTDQEILRDGGWIYQGSSHADREQARKAVTFRLVILPISRPSGTARINHGGVDVRETHREMREWSEVIRMQAESSQRKRQGFMDLGSMEDVFGAADLEILHRHLRTHRDNVVNRSRTVGAMTRREEVRTMCYVGSGTLWRRLRRIDTGRARREQVSWPEIVVSAILAGDTDLAMMKMEALVQFGLVERVDTDTRNWGAARMMLRESRKGATTRAVTEKALEQFSRQESCLLLAERFLEP